MNLCTYRYVHLNLSLAQVLPPLSHIQAACGDLSRQEVGKEAGASDPGVFRKRQRDAVQSLVSLGKGGAIATLLLTPQQGGRSRTSRAPRAAAKQAIGHHHPGGSHVSPEGGALRSLSCCCQRGGSSWCPWRRGRLERRVTSAKSGSCTKISPESSLWVLAYRFAGCNLHD